HRDGKHWIMQVDLGQPGNGAEQHVLDAGKPGVRDGDRIAVAAQPSGDPEDVDLLHGRWSMRLQLLADRACHALPPLRLRKCSPLVRSTRGSETRPLYDGEAREARTQGGTRALTHARQLFAG